jgi:hypothetical protein
MISRASKGWALGWFGRCIKARIFRPLVAHKDVHPLLSLFCSHDSKSAFLVTLITRTPQHPQMP